MITTVPVQPDPDTARGWLQAELADPVYHERVDLMSLLLTWLQEKWAELLEAADGRMSLGAAWVVVAALAVVALVTWWVAGPLRRRRGAGRGSTDVFGDDLRTAAEHRAAAAAASARHDWDTAVLEGYRALLRGLDERALLDLVPGSTAHEGAHDAALRFPDREVELVAVSVLFDDVRYGHRSAGEADARAVGELDAALAAATPVRVPEPAGAP